MLRGAQVANAEPPPVVAPTGVGEVLAGNMGYRPNGKYRNAHHGGRCAPRNGHGLVVSSFDPSDESELMTLFVEHGVRIEMFLVDRWAFDLGKQRMYHRRLRY